MRPISGGAVFKAQSAKSGGSENIWMRTYKRGFHMACHIGGYITWVYSLNSNAQWFDFGSQVPREFVNKCLCNMALDRNTKVLQK